MWLCWRPRVTQKGLEQGDVSPVPPFSTSPRPPPGKQHSAKECVCVLSAAMHVGLWQPLPLERR